MLNVHALFHRHLVQLFVVVGLGHILGVSLAFKVHEWCHVVRDALLILDIPKDVEQLLVLLLRELDLFWQVILQVAVGASLSRLVGLVFLSTHGHHVLNAAFNDCATDVVHAQDELKQLLQLLLGVDEDVFEAEEVNWFLCVLSDLNPILEPPSVRFCRLVLESLPVR